MSTVIFFILFIYLGGGAGEESSVEVPIRVIWLLRGCQREQAKDRKQERKNAMEEDREKEREKMKQR